MSTNGKTATDFSGIVGAAGAGAGAGTAAVGTEVGAALRLDTHRRSIANPAMAKPIREATMIAARFGCRADGNGAGARCFGAAFGVTTGACMATRTASISFGIERAISPPLASSHWEVFRKYSRPAGNGAWSTLSETTGWRFEAARSPS